jgi:hypothetical protein
MYKRSPIWTYILDHLPQEKKTPIYQCQSDWRGCLSKQIAYLTKVPLGEFLKTFQDLIAEKLGIDFPFSYDS